MRFAAELGIPHTPSDPGGGTRSYSALHITGGQFNKKLIDKKFRVWTWDFLGLEIETLGLPGSVFCIVGMPFDVPREVWSILEISGFRFSTFSSEVWSILEHLRIFTFWREEIKDPQGVKRVRN